MPRRRGRGRPSAATNGFTHPDLLAAPSAGGGLQTKQATSLEESVRDALELKASPGYHLEVIPTASLDSNSTSHSAMSENSRRSSASSAAALRDGDSLRPGKRKRRTDAMESAIDSSYSLRRRRSRILPDANGDRYSQPLESPRESSNPQDPEMEYFSNELANHAPEESFEVDRQTEADDGDIPMIVEPKKRGRRGYRFRQETPLLESVLATPAPGTPMNGNDLGTGVNTDQEPARLVRRLPGRRRAPNPNSSIEADLRRQLTLKTTFRSVVKALKPVLLELSNRSIEQLEEHEDAYMECPEYDEIVAQLDLYLKRRLGKVDAQYELDMKRIEDDLKNGNQYIHDEYDYRVEEAKDEHVHRALNGLAGAQIASRREIDEDLTEDEGDGASTMVAPTDSVIYARPGIGKSISRSHIFLGVEKLGEVDEVHDAINSRINHAIAPIEGELDEEIMELETGLGSMDLTRREEAIRLLNIQCLADAAEAAEAADKATAAAVRRRSKRNEDHSGFDALLEASKMPAFYLNGQDDFMDQSGRPLRSRVRTARYRGQPDMDEPMDEEQTFIKSQLTSPGTSTFVEPMDMSRNLNHNAPPPDTKVSNRRINIGSLLTDEPEGYGSSSTDYEMPKKGFHGDVPGDGIPWSSGDQKNLSGTSGFRNPFIGDVLKPITSLQPSSDFGGTRTQSSGFPDVAQSIEDDPFDRNSKHTATSHLDELQDPRLDQRLPSPNIPKHLQFSTPLPPRLPPTSHIPPDVQSDELRSDYPHPIQPESRYQPFTTVQSTWQPPLWPYQKSVDRSPQPQFLPPNQLTPPTRENLPEEKFETPDQPEKIESLPFSSSSTQWQNNISSPQPSGFPNDQQGHVQPDEKTEQLLLPALHALVKEESTGSVPVEDAMDEDELADGNVN